MTADRPSAENFADVAEQRRLQGDALAAVQIAESGLAQAPDDLRGRIVLALARIDLGDVLEARDELAAALRFGAAGESLVADLLRDEPEDEITGELEDDLPGELAGELDDDELETAFAQAESDPDQMMDANRVVEQTLRAAELDTPEADFDISSNPTYATESMAALLDRQGRHTEAEALRLSLSRALASREGSRGETSQQSGRESAAFGPEHAQRLRVVATLEGWLHNLRRGAENDARLRERNGARESA